MLELWFDFSCPYAYLASRLASRFGTAIDWRPMLLGGVFRGIGAGDGPMATLSRAKAEHNFHDMHRWAAHFGIPFQMPPAHPMRTVRALRTLLALPHSRWPQAIEAIYAAYWQRAEDVTSDAVIARALEGAGVSAADIASAQTRADDPAIKDELRARTDEAIALGIFGAPAWILRRESGPLLIWGQDRLDFVQAALAGWDPEARPPPGGARPFLEAPPAKPGATLDVYFDISSPFAYLALTQLPALACATGVTPRLVPILLGALFKQIDQVNVPLLAMPAPKQRYIGLDMHRWARWWGEPFVFPAKFPQRTVDAQRLCILAAERGFDPGVKLATALARAMWAHGKDLEDRAVLRSVLEECGMPGGWIDRTGEAELKQALFDNTSAAIANKVFGVPTFIVNGTQLLWGQDRLELVAAELAR